MAERTMEKSSNAKEALSVSQESLFDIVALESSAPAHINGVVVGVIKSFAKDGTPLVDFYPNASGRQVPARSTVPLQEELVDREVALLFERGDPQKPIIIGLMWAPGTTDSSFGKLEARVDEERVCLSADKEIVLRCGEASLTLTKAGKILIRGKYVLSRSSGVNRIKGGSVQIN